MKNVIFYLVFAVAIIAFAACSSKKSVSKSSLETPLVSTYTVDNTQSSSDTTVIQEEIVEPKPIVHIVKKGESLWVIARRYGVTVKAIAEANNIENTSLIKINQELVIPDKKED